MTTLRQQEAAPGQIRVSIRDIRESAYRALVAHGASHGEAGTAADQVLDAELHSGAGLVALLADLALPPWPRAGMTLTRRAALAPHPDALVVNGEGRSTVLRQGCLLTELNVSQSASTALVCSPDLAELHAAIDLLLLEAAALAGQAVAAVLLAEAGQPVAARAGDPAGGAGPVGLVDVLPGHMTEHLRVCLPHGGVAVLRPAQVEPAAGWLDADARSSRRRRAAEAGVTVDAHAWEASYGAARGFLVPEG